MKTTLATATLAAILSVSAAGAVSAMPAAKAPAAAPAPVELVGHHGYHRILPRPVIVRTLRRQGYQNIRDIRLVRGDYVLRARGYRGEVRLVVDGRTARVLSRTLLSSNHGHGHGHNQSGIWFNGSNGNFSYSFGVR